MPLAAFVKRIYVWYFDREQIHSSIKQRMGCCKQCGLCCTFFNIKCPFLDKNNSCTIIQLTAKFVM